MSFFKRSNKNKNKNNEKEEEIDYVVMNSDPTKFVAKVYSDNGSDQLVRYIDENTLITSVTVHCPALTDQKPMTMTTAGFIRIVEGLVALQRITQFKFSGYNLSTHINAILPYFFPTVTMNTIGFWRASLDDMLAYSTVVTLLTLPVVTSINLGENKLTESGRQMIETVVASSGNPMLKVAMF